MAVPLQRWVLIAVAWVFLIIMSLGLALWWFAVFFMVVGPVLFVTYWRTATFREVVDESRAITTGRYLVPQEIRQVSGEATLVSTRQARPVMAVFDHASRNDRVWVALAGGRVEGFNVEQRAAFAVKEDSFERWRPCETIAPRFHIDLDGFQPLLATLWNAEISGREHVLASEVGGHESEHVRQAVVLGLVKTPPLHKNLGERVSIEPSGRVVLAAQERADGNEIYPGAKEARVGDVVNYGIWNDHSPGAAAVQGAGTAIGGHVGGLDAEIIDMLRQLVVTAGEVSSELEPDDRDVVEASAEAIDDLLSSDRPNHARLRRAARMVLDRIEPIVLGAAGSGVWTALAHWARS